MESSLHIGILGIGAIGSVFASLLQEQKSWKLHLFNRSSKKDIHVRFPDQTYHIQQETKKSLQEMKSLDWLFICLKEYHYEQAKSLIQSLIGEKTRVVLIRNGLQLSKSIEGLCPQHRILETIIDCPTEKISDQAYAAFQYPILYLPEQEGSKVFQQLMPPLISVRTIEDFDIQSWKKCIESSCLGLLMIYVDGDCGAIRQGNFIPLYKSLIQEAMLIAAAENIVLEASFVEQLEEKFHAYPDEKQSSMYRDYRSNSEIEWKAKSGLIQSMADQHGIALPTHQMIFNTLNLEV